MDEIWLNPSPPYDPIDWSDVNQWAFLSGVFIQRTMSRKEFDEKYPTPQPAQSA